MQDKAKASSIVLIIVFSALIRIIPIFYLQGMESISEQNLSITDIDYKVYTDAASKASPYDRHTYRYSPLLSYLMAFNSQWEIAGKLIFVLFDVIAMLGLVVFARQAHKINFLKLYGFNPLFIYLTVRGSCESINMALMFWTLGFIFSSNGNVCLGHFAEKKLEDRRRNTWLGYILYGLWVHFRVYPIIFLPIILIH